MFIATPLKTGPSSRGAKEGLDYTLRSSGAMKPQIARQSINISSLRDVKKLR